MSPARVRAKLVAAKVALVERMLVGITSLPLASEASFLVDPRMVAAGESFLRRALEALFDLGRHLVAKGFGDPATEYKEIAERLGRHGVLTSELGARLRSMAGYRNRLVHFYEEVGPTELYEILTIHLADVRKILAALQDWVGAHPELVDGEL